MFSTASKTPSNLHQLNRPAQLDAKQTLEFLQALDTGACEFALQSLWDDKRAPPPVSRNYTLEEMRAVIASNNSAACPMGWFAVVNKSKNGRRTKGDIERVRAVFIDADKDEKKAKARERGEAVQEDADGEYLARVEAAVKDFPLAPSMVIESSPGKKHFYWLIMGDDFPLDEFEIVQAALAEHFNTDDAVKDLARVMRLPGTLHCKSGKPVTMVKTEKLDASKRYTYAEINEIEAVQAWRK